jgi:hypothetical protein
MSDLCKQLSSKYKVFSYICQVRPICMALVIKLLCLARTFLR